jgi:SPP1 gp7 family putative phage head morphogenesis protein
VPTAIDQRLASIWHRDRIDLHADVERLVASLGQPYRQLFRGLMGLAADDEAPTDREIDELLATAHHAAEQQIKARFARQAEQAHKRALGGFAATVPRRWFRVLGVFRERQAEPAKPKPSKDEWERELADMTFPAPSKQDVDQWLDHKGPEGKAWDERLAYWQADARGRIRGELTQAFTSGEGLSKIRGRLKPITDGLNYKAQRIARTEGRRIGELAQQRMIQQAGDLVAAQEILAVLDERTDPEHAARHGTRYERQQDGTFISADGEPAPDLPDRANCRCYLSPILADMDKLLDDAPELGADFANASAEVIPDPSAYSTWFDDATPSQQAAAVGVGRYRAAQAVLDVQPEWEDFLDPDGRLMTVKAIKGESLADREARLAAVRQSIEARRALLTQAGVETEPESKASRRGESAADVKAAIAATAEDYGVDPGSLKEALGALREEKNEYIRDARKAKEGIHKATFLSPADCRKLNNAGLDYTAKEHQIAAALGDTKESRRLATSLSQFDERATVLAREYPVLELGNADDGGADTSGTLWESLLGEKPQQVGQTDPALLREAAEWVKSSAVVEPVTLLEAVPF